MKIYLKSLFKYGFLSITINRMNFFRKKTYRVSLLVAALGLSFGSAGKIFSQVPSLGTTGIVGNREIHLSDNVPPEILLSKAWASFDLHRIGDAHLYANAAWKKNGNNLPEANYIIGLVHYSNADYRLAKYYFDRALNEEKTPASRIYYLYALAAIYIAEAKINQYVQTMRDIMTGGLATNRLELLKNQRQQARKILFKSGLDRVLELYRWPGRRDLFAAESLAMLTYQRSVLSEQGRLPRQERPLFDIVEPDTVSHEVVLGSDGMYVRPDVAESVELLLYALDSQVAIIINRLKYYRPDYTFTSLSQLFTDVSSYREIQDYIEQGGLYRILYFLGVAMHRYSPNDTQYKVLMNMLRLIPEAGEWARRAQAQFNMPYIETYGLESTELIAVSRGQTTDSLNLLF